MTSTLHFIPTFDPKAETAPNQLFQTAEGGYDPNVELTVGAFNAQGKYWQEVHTFRKTKEGDMNMDPVEIQVASLWTAATLTLKTQQGPCTTILATKKITNNAFDGPNPAFEITFGCSRTGRLRGEIQNAR